MFRWKHFSDKGVVDRVLGCRRTTSSFLRTAMSLWYKRLYMRNWGIPGMWMTAVKPVIDTSASMGTPENVPRIPSSRSSVLWKELKMVSYSVQVWQQ